MTSFISRLITIKVPKSMGIKNGSGQWRVRGFRDAWKKSILLLEHFYTSFELFFGYLPPMYVRMCGLCGSYLTRKLLLTHANSNLMFNINTILLVWIKNFTIYLVIKKLHYRCWIIPQNWVGRYSNVIWILS